MATQYLREPNNSGSESMLRRISFIDRTRRSMTNEIIQFDDFVISGIGPDARYFAKQSMEMRVGHVPSEGSAKHSRQGMFMGD